MTSRLHRASAAFTADLSLEELPRFPCRPDKRPLIARWFKAATTDPAQIAVWQAEFPNCLWGVPTGAISGIDVLESIQRDLGGSRRTATSFQSLVYIARRGAVCICFSSTHRVCAAHGDGLPLESMSARMEAM